MLNPMLSDPIDYVRQGALIATSMVLMQSAAHEPDSRLTEHRKLLAKVAGDKHEDTMAKFGAIIATGILDAGGRNMSIALMSKSGHKIMPAIIGLGVFTHFWFWHPLMLFINLALTPTCAIGVNAKLQMPTWRFRSNAPPATYAYPPIGQKESKEEVKLAAAVLSITGKKKKADAEADAERAMEEKAAAEKLRAEQITAARDETITLLADLRKRGAFTSEVHAEIVGEALAAEAEKKKEDSKKDEKKEEKMAVEDDASKPSLAVLYEKLKAAHARGALSTATMSAAWAAKPPPPPAILAPPPKEKEEDKAKEGDAKKEGEKKEEPKPVEPKLEPEYAEPKLEAEVLENPARVLRAQERVVAPLPGSRYVPISDNRRSGIIVLKDTTPDDEEELLRATALHAPSGTDPDLEEPEPPAPFEFTG